MVATALVVQGCGGGDSEPLRKAEFLQQGNEICKVANAEREEGSKESVNGSSEAGDMEGFVTEVALPPIQKMTSELGDLGAPKGDEKQVEAIVQGFESSAEQLEGDPVGVTSDSFSAASKQAAAYGLTECVI